MFTGGCFGPEVSPTLEALKSASLTLDSDPFILLAPDLFSTVGVFALPMMLCLFSPIVLKHALLP